MRSTLFFIAALFVTASAEAAEVDPRVAAAPTDPDAPATPPADDERPWAKGVSEGEQKVAFEIFTEATALLKDSFFTRAVAKYEEALTHWDHPAIHFNLAKALMNLDRPVDAYTHLGMAMKYGGPPLDTEEQQQVERYKKLLYESELAELRVVSNEQGAVVTMNGAQLFVAPGEWQGVVSPNNVTLLATKEGYQTTQVKPTLDKGQVNNISLELVPLESSVRYTRAFGNWIPWTVVSVGALLLGGGAFSTWQSGKQFAAYDDAITRCNLTTATDIIDDNGDPTGGQINACKPTSAITSKKDSAETFGTLSTVGYIAGGAVLATGIVLLYVNREKPIVVEGSAEPVSLVPYFGPTGAGISATVGF